MRSGLTLRWVPLGPAAALLAIAAYVATLSWSMQHHSFHIWSGYLVAPVLIALTVPVAVRTARDDPWLGRMLMVFLIVKLAGALVRYTVGETVYGGSADSNSYASWGVQLAEAYRSGYLIQDVGREVIGTGFIRILTGVVFVLSGSSKIGGFLVFSWLSFWGLFFFYRAMRAGFPEADHRRYGLLLFLLPSHLYWPSSIGKEAWMLFALGLAAWGTAKLTVRERGGYPLLALGLIAIAMVRPHMGILICGGLVAAILLRRSASSALFGPIGKAALLVGLLAVSFVMLQRTEAFFGVTDDEQDGAGVTTILETTADQTGKGGSEFQAVTARSPAQLPAATVAVLFRPFPWEAGNAQSLAASFEGAFLAVMYLLSARRLRGFVRWARQRPYLVFAAVYTVLFVIAFSNIGNFGILARQRVQLFPVLLTLLALPRPAGRGSRIATGTQLPERQGVRQ